MANTNSPVCRSVILPRDDWEVTFRRSGVTTGTSVHQDLTGADTYYQLDYTSYSAPVRANVTTKGLPPSTQSWLSDDVVIQSDGTMTASAVEGMTASATLSCVTNLRTEVVRGINIGSVVTNLKTTFVDFVSGTFMHHVYYAAETRVRAASAVATAANIYSTLGNLTSPWVRNNTFWLSGSNPLDCTAVSPWNSTGGYDRGGLAITKRHIAFASHYPILPGASIVFITNDNQTISRTVLSGISISSRYADQTLYSDAAVAILDADLPNSITPVPVLDYNRLYHVADDAGAGSVIYYSEFGYTTPSYRVVFDNTKKATLWDASVAYSTGAYNDPKYNNLRVSLGGGDSGSPGCYIINNKLALQSTLYQISYGPSWSQLNSVFERNNTYTGGITDLNCAIGKLNEYAGLSTMAHQASAPNYDAFPILNNNVVWEDLS